MNSALVFWRGTAVYMMAKVDSPTLPGKPYFCHCPYRGQPRTWPGYFFNPAVQFSTTVIGDVLAAASCMTVLSRNRPSGATS